MNAADAPKRYDCPERLAAGVLAGERRALAKAITLVESRRADHQRAAGELLQVLLPHTGRALRIGMSGVPGVGKSTFIECFGLFLVAHGHRPAVLAIDPSSSVSGGSILGDKTRMERLAVHPQAFIRPSPSGGALGGVAARTREALLLCEAAGYDVVIVETVGVGQSETAVAAMTDVFCLLQLPNAGDDLQAIKKGVMELADLIVVNKADSDLAAARRAQSQINAALRLFRHTSAHWRPQVLLASALRGEGLEAVYQALCAHRAALQAAGELESKRREQARAWMWRALEGALLAGFREHAGVARRLPEVEAAVLAGRVSPSAAAAELLQIWRTPG